MGLPMISCSYFVRGMTGFPMNILPLNRSLYDQFFLYLVMAYLVFLWPAFPISAFLCLRSYIYTWHKWSSYICSSHHWFSYEQPSYHCVPIFAFLWLRLPISMSSCGKGWLRCNESTLKQVAQILLIKLVPIITSTSKASLEYEHI